MEGDALVRMIIVLIEGAKAEEDLLSKRERCLTLTVKTEGQPDVSNAGTDGPIIQIEQGNWTGKGPLC